MGWPQFFWQLHETQKAYEQSLPSKEEVFRGRIALRSYVETRVACARQKISEGKGYTYADYFGDLKNYDLEARALKIDGDGAWSGFNQLQQLITQHPQKDYDDLQVARDNYQDFSSGMQESREKARKSFKALGLAGVSWWLWSMYVKFMLPALLLFAVWLYEYHRESRREKKYESPFPNPWRFMFLLLGYPVVISFFTWKYMKAGGRNIVFEAELRRSRRDLFGTLSKEELKLLREFKNSGFSFSAWQRHLSSIGLTPRHCFAAALIAAIVLQLLPSVSYAQAKEGAKSETAWMQGLQVLHPDIGNDGQSQHGMSHQIHDAVSIEPFDLEIIPPVNILEIRQMLSNLKGVNRSIDHVPISSAVQPMVCHEKTD